MAASMPAQRAAPRLAFYRASELVAPQQQKDALDEALALGFSGILVGSLLAPHAQGRPADPGLLGELNASRHPTSSSSADRIVLLAKTCRTIGLEFVVDVPLERAVPNTGLLARLAPWSPSRDAPLNPRADDFGRPGARIPWHEASCSDKLQEEFMALFERLADLGVHGVRLLGLQAVAVDALAAIVKQIRVRRPQLALLADTEGLSSQAVDALSAISWDGCMGSLPWWNCRAAWFFDEYRRLARLGPVIQSVAATSEDNPDGHDALRRTRIAALLGDGLLLPALSLSRYTAADPAFRSSLIEANGWLARTGALHAPTLPVLSAPDASITVVRRRVNDEDLLVAINSTEFAQASAADQFTAALDRPAAKLQALSLLAQSSPTPDAEPAGLLMLQPREVLLLRPMYLPAVVSPEPLRQTVRRDLTQAMASPRAAIEAVQPVIDAGRFAVRAMAGAPLDVSADVFCDGHDALLAYVQWRALDTDVWQEAPMRPLGNERYAGRIGLDRLGRHEFRIVAFIDRFASWLYGTGKKKDAGLDIHLEVLEGCALVAAFADQSENKALRKLDAELKKPRRSVQQALAFRTEALLNPATAVMMQDADPRHHLSLSPHFPLFAERRAARSSSWYELFPRSMSARPGEHGTFQDVISHLPRIAKMGFDVLYFPPIHPIGTAHRKGRNNALTAAPSDPGSPYAIGAAEGGHDAIHPQLGSREDFLALVAAARTFEIEIALDFAIQCSPDHPWLKDHPHWFNFRPDGTVRYAENPPKKYEDIVNVDFYSDRADAREKTPAHALWLALRDIVLYWVGQGVKIFRVDNPHTKPLPFWEWMIAQVLDRHPDVIFLAEAFTTPKMMARLAKIGFTQSYSYFTWRNTKWELSQYVTELTSPPLSLVYRPNFFVNTPDINPQFLQWSGRPGFLIRAALATMLSAVWGMYSGFELCEAEAMPGKEEYMNSEKYELRQRDFNQAGNITAEITRLNAIRHSNPALATQLGVQFHQATNDQILFFARFTPARDNVLLIAINLDPRSMQECDIELPLWDFGLPDQGGLVVDDLIEGHHFNWYGKWQHLRIDPAHCPYKIWRVAPLDH